MLERLAKVDRVVFDKTGTLTERHAEVTAVDRGAGRHHGRGAARWRPRSRPRATTRSRWPSRRPRPADRRRVGDRGRASVPGVGRGGHRRRPLASRSGGLMPDAASPPRSAGEVAAPRTAGRDGGGGRRATAQVVGAIAVTTPLRPEAAPAVAHLQAMGLPSVILSGDSAPAVRTRGRRPRDRRTPAAGSARPARSTPWPRCGTRIERGAHGRRRGQRRPGAGRRRRRLRHRQRVGGRPGQQRRRPARQRPARASPRRSAWPGRPTRSSCRTSGGPWATTSPRCPWPRSGSSTRWWPRWPWDCPA